MRTIKFRGKRVDNGKLVYGYYWSFNDIHFIRSGSNLHSTDYEVHPETVGQFTGLLDKDGKEIYEGDIIKMGYNPECWFSPRVVEFINGSWMGRGCRIYTDQDSRDYKGDPNQNNWEIIGNIHDNPELL